MKRHGLLQKRKARAAEVYQTAKLFELLPSGPNGLWQMAVTHIHIPGCGRWYAVTVIAQPLALCEGRPREAGGTDAARGVAGAESLSRRRRKIPVEL